MNKDFELKKDPQYSFGPLRQRISRMTKMGRDYGDELSQSMTKILPMIPVTGKGRLHKYFHNKSSRGY